MKVWNKETRNDNGEFYRTQDWAIERDADFLTNHPRAANFTPLYEDDGETPKKQDWDGTQWVEDSNLTNAEKEAKLARLMAKDLNVNKQLFYIWEAIDAMDQGLELPAKAQAAIQKVRNIRQELSS